MKKSLKTVVTAATFAALICVATIIVQIPISAGGYVNLGDTFVLLAGWFIGPIYGGIAAAIGSVLADLITGYAIYAPATFIIKGVMAILASLLSVGLSKKLTKSMFFPFLLSAIVAELFMIFGYYIFELILSGNSVAALTTLPSNAVQGIFGIVASLLCRTVLKKTKLF